MDAAPSSTGPSGWVRTSAHTACLRAPNPGPMTLEGTNTYVIGDLPRDWPADGSRPGVIVVDPGPEDPAHLRRLTERTQVELILLTHRHADHAAGAPALHAMTGAPVRAWEEALCLGVPPLLDGEILTVEEVEITVLHTPGHTSDSVCLVVPADSAILTGDMILGSGTTMLDYPDGGLEDYLDSIRDLIELGDLLVLPAHGSCGAQLDEVGDRLLQHRLDRVHQLREMIRSAEDDIAPSASELTAQIYGEVPEQVRASALKTLKAQLAYLVDLGEIAGFTD